MKSPLDIFFNLGNKITKGDQKRKADFDYYMLWIIFVAFFSIFVDNLYFFIKTLQISKLGWAIVIFGILWFQYFGLKMSYESRKLMKTVINYDKKEKIENVSEMIKGFAKNDDLKGGKKCKNERKKTLTEKMRANPYMVGTFVLGICCLLFLFLGFIKAEQEINGWKKDVCEDMHRFKVGTPAWFDYQGNYIVSSYLPVTENKTLEEIGDLFLKHKVYLVYSDKCGWCKKQINDFKKIGFWEEYQKEGLTIKCE